MKIILIDVVVVDIHPKYGMLLFRYCPMKMEGTLQMDYSYATVPIFVGEIRLLYRDVQLACLVSGHLNPPNHPLFVF